MKQFVTRTERVPLRHIRRIRSICYYYYFFILLSRVLPFRFFCTVIYIFSFQHQIYTVCTYSFLITRPTRIHWNTRITYCVYLHIVYFRAHTTHTTEGRGNKLKVTTNVRIGLLFVYCNAMASVAAAP